jgi:Ca2+-binding RTX toxin-like protein
MRVTDSAGNPGTATEKTITIDTTAPTIASVTLEDGTHKIGDDVALTITATNNEADLTLSPATFNGQTLTNIKDNGDGSYSATYTVQKGDPDLSDGDNATANLAFTDPAGNSGPAVTSVALSGETIDATAPTTTLTIDSISLDTGSANNDFITNDNDGLTINATLSTQLAPGETLEYSADNGATWSDISSAVSETGTKTAITHTDASLTSDATIQMRVTDSAGNPGTAVEKTIDVDTEAPKAPELNQVTGDNLINASEAAAGFDITGTGEPGATITLAGPTLAGGNTATVQNDGTWSIPVTKADVTAMGEGNTNLSLTQTDPAGNISPPTMQSITVDTEAPEAPALNQVTGDNIINASEAEDGFDITGTGEPGATITLAGPALAGGNTATVQNDGTWSIPVTKADVTAMGEGNTNLSLTQTDPAGNISDPTTQSITVDALPAILSADMSFGEVLTPDEMDEQADLTVKTANIEDGATISISIDGVSMTPVSATIEANKAVFSASAEELQSLRDGTYEFTLTVTDFPSVQKVQSFKKTGDIDGTENDDTITPTSGPNNTPYADGDGDNVDGGDGTDDYIDAKGGNDIVDGGQGNDIIHGGTGNDILNGGVGDDTLDGGSGNDLLRGDTGNDSLKGGDGQDDLQGGDGDDSLDGGDGNDVLDGGTGADTLTGGAGRDEFKVEAGDTVTDFDIEEDKIDLDDIYNFDTLALWNAENPNNSFSTPLQWLKSDQADGDGLAGLNQNGVPINLMNDGAFINASDLTQTNTGVVCYGAKTRIETIDGLVEIDRLQPGDLVKTGGNGHHPIRWIRGRTIFHAELQAHPNLVPVRIKAGAMGKGLPKRDLIISQHHRMIVSSDLSSVETGSKEIFIAAKDLIGVPGIEIAIDLTEITYWHFICDQHQVVFAEGAASESLYTGPEALKMLGAEARAEIYQIFPELRDAPPHYAPKPARPILTQAESKSLIFQHYRSRTALCRQNSDAGMRPV